METTPAKRVLLVQGDRFLGRACEDALLGRGLEVRTAADGGEALAVARTDTPDLILLDLMMPAPSDVQILRRLKADPATRDIPVLVLANSAREAKLNEVLKLGALEFWVKADISLKDLAYRVVSLLERPTPAPH
jgi:CheY-like chemotaxis protein